MGVHRSGQRTKPIHSFLGMYAGRRQIVRNIRESSSEESGWKRNVWVGGIDAEFGLYRDGERDQKRFMTGFLNTLSLPRQATLVLSGLLLATRVTIGQVVSGSDGRDGDLVVPSEGLTLSMADRPDGVFRFKSVSIRGDLRFTPNTHNSPVILLVMGDFEIKAGGILEISGANGTFDGEPGFAGPGGFSGGRMGSSPRNGSGPGGGQSHPDTSGGGGSHATAGKAEPNPPLRIAPAYGNELVTLLIGGSGGGGSMWGSGGGGGGALLIVSQGEVRLNGPIRANGGNGGTGGGVWAKGGGGGAGGAVRIVAPRIVGTGPIETSGDQWFGNRGGDGWIRLDAIDNSFTGSFRGTKVSTGFNPVFFLGPVGTLGLAIESINGAPPAPGINVIPGTSGQPSLVSVRCVGIPLGTPVTVEALPRSGPPVAAVGVNTTGTTASSTAQIAIQLPPGNGTLTAKCQVLLEGGVPGSPGPNGIPGLSPSRQGASTTASLPAGFVLGGERIRSIETSVTADGASAISYTTESGRVIRDTPATPK
jgi:hypothetical protein